MVTKRELIEPHPGDKRFVRRDAKGRTESSGAPTQRWDRRRRSGRPFGQGANSFAMNPRTTLVKRRQRPEAAAVHHRLG
jgi:hypothetical protein